MKSVPLDQLKDLHAQGLSVREMAEALGFWKGNIVYNLKKLGLTVPLSPKHRPWSDAEQTQLREVWPDVVAGKIVARDLVERFPGRSRDNLYAAAARFGITGERSPQKRPENWVEIMKEKLALGWNDSEIAALWGMDRRWLAALRKRRGIKASGCSARLRARISVKTRQQLDKAGLKSLADLRKQRFHALATSLGWPEGLRPRAVQVIELLVVEPMLTRREICSRLNLPWKNCKKNGLQGNGKGGTYLAHLIAAGLVVSSPRVKYGTGKGQSCRVYSATPVALQMKADFLRGNDGSQINGPCDGVEQHLNDDQSAGGQAAAAHSEQADRRTTRQRRRSSASKS